MKNYIKSAQFAGILIAVFGWTATFTFFKIDGQVLMPFVVFTSIITLLLPFCSTKPD